MGDITDADLWTGPRWAGDTRFGHCSACGKKASAGDRDDDWWHSYATEMVECKDKSAAFIEEGRF